MRLITWNCRIGGFRKKAKRVASLRPDVLAVQEVEPLDRVQRFEGEFQPTYRHRTADPAYPSRGIGVFSYAETQLAPADSLEPLHCFRRYSAQRRELQFQVVAIWTAATKRRATSYKQAHLGLHSHGEWVQQLPTVLLGDFNGNASLQTGDWQGLLGLMGSLGLVSAYHHFFSEPFGAETRPTHFHKGKATSPFHLDYCFLPALWADRITKVEVGTYDDWHAVSDHAPLTVDLDL